MSHPKVHITEALELDLSDPHSLSLRYPGDVRLSQTFGRPLAGAQVGGDLELDLPTVTGTCVAQGTLKTASKVDAIRLTGRELHLSGGEIRARALSATERILIGPCTLKVDVIIAPVVIIDPEAKGRVTVVESQNELGPTKIRGAFSLSEYEENFGGAIDFLAGRGVGPLDPAVDIDELLSRPRAIVTTAPRPQPAETGPHDEPEELDDFVELELLDEDDDSFEGVTLVGMSASDIGVADPAAETTLDDVPPQRDAINAAQDEDDGIIEPARPLPPRAPTPSPPPQRPPADSPAARRWFRQLDALADSIEQAYATPPDGVIALRELINSRQPERLEHELDQVWTDTVKHHRQTREPVHPGVAHRMRVLADLVKQRPV